MINAGKQLLKLTECCICFKGFTDPRILSCIHTFCLECLRRTGEASKKGPGESIPCPLCRKEFVIPPEGMNDLQKNFFMENLMENLKNVAIQSQMDSKSVLVCDMCKVFYEEGAEKTEAATMKCLECKENYCDACAKRHKLSKASSTHKLMKIGSETETVIRKIQPTRYCSVHTQEPLNLYCIDCKKILCMLCSVEKHETHKRQAVTTVHKEFRQTIQQDAVKISKCIEEIRSKEKMMDEKKEEILFAVAETEARIKQRNSELKAMIDSQTNSMLEELSLTKQAQIKHFANAKEEIDRFHTILESFKTYCTELITKGSDCDVCCSVEGLATRASELLKNHEEFIGRPFQMIKVSFENIELGKLLDQPYNNILGRIECRSTDCSSDRPDDASISSDVETSTIIIGSASVAEDHSASKVHESDPIPNDDVVTSATDETKKEKVTDDIMLDTESEQQSSSSMQNDKMERIEDAVTTSSMPDRKDHDYENRGHRAIAFPDAIAKHKEMLKKMRDQLMRIKSQPNDKRSSLFLKKEHAENFRQQFGHVKCILSDRLETAEWKSIELCHDKLMKLICAETEGLRSARLPVLEEVKSIIDEILKNLNILEASSQQGLRNTGRPNNYNFNAVIQCLCQTYLLLDDLCSTTTPEQRLTEEFVEFSNHGNLSPAKQKDAFSRFYKQLCASQSKFSNFRQYDSHDLFVEFLNLLRSEERLHTTKDPRFKGDTSKVLTAVDKVFGGHFITMCTCLSCDRAHCVCDYMLDISLPISTPCKRASGTIATTVDKRRELRRSLNSDQHKEMMRSFLEALNEEINIQEEGDRGDFSRPVTITDCLRSYTAECMPKDNHCLSCQGGSTASATASVQAMPSVVKRTLIYDPPAILVLHIKRFVQTATGLKKRCQKVIYEELLNIGPYCSSDCLRIDPEDKNIWYSLYGVIVHIGSLESGHYIAYVKVGKSKSKATKTFLQKSFLDRDQVATKRKQMLESGGKRADRKEEWNPISSTDGKWIQVSDNNTRDVTSSEALKQEAFMLFYERIPKYGL